jgi:hypothetical protein
VPTGFPDYFPGLTRVDLFVQAAVIGATTIVVTDVDAYWEAKVEIFLNDTSGLASNITVSILSTQKGGVNSQNTCAVSSPGAGGAFAGGVAEMYADALTNIQYVTTGTLHAGDTYDLHIRLQELA